MTHRPTREARAALAAAEERASPALLARMAFAFAARREAAPLSFAAAMRASDAIAARHLATIKELEMALAEARGRA